QNELVNKMPSDDVRGIRRRRAVRNAPAPINRTCSPKPYFAKASGGTNPRTFSDPVKIISPPIRMCRPRPAILPQFLLSFIMLLLSSERLPRGRYSGSPRVNGFPSAGRSQLVTMAGQPGLPRHDDLVA